jgi:hypothetical protein
MAQSAQVCDRLKAALAFDTSVIQAFTEREIDESPNPLLSIIPSASYENGIGADPRWIRYAPAPNEYRAYQPLIDSNTDEARTMPGRGCDGSDVDITTNVNGVDGNCDIPGQTVHLGFDVFGREAFVKAYETEPVCLMTMFQYGPDHIAAYRRGLRDSLMRTGREQYEYAVEDIVIENAKYLISCDGTINQSTGSWLGEPTSGLSHGLVRFWEPILRREGYKGQFTVLTSQVAFENMRAAYKAAKGVDLNSTMDSNETELLPPGTQSVVWDGVRYVFLMEPIRGFLRDTPSGGKQFVRVFPTVARAGTGGGLVWDINQDYWLCKTVCDGIERELYEVGFFVDPSFAERQALAAPNSLLEGHVANKSFNFDVKLVDDAHIDCNKDNFKAQLRMLHGWGFQLKNPEVAGAFLYKVAPQSIEVYSPECPERTTATEEIVGPEGFPQPHDDCSLAAAVAEADKADNDCPADPEAYVGDDPSEVGVISVVDATLCVGEDAGSILVSVQRTGGSSGAASVDVDTADGTATAGVNYTAVVGTTLNWADGDQSIKQVTISITDTDALDTSTVDFDVDLSSVVGATLGDAQTVVTIIGDNAECP